MKHTLFLFLVLGSATGAQAEPIDFEKQIRPLLREQCVRCHGPTKQKGELRLDARGFAMRNPATIRPGKSGMSELFQRVSSRDESERMPPDRPLSPEQIALLQQWIDEGATWTETEADREAARDRRVDHWAWKPIRPQAVPEATGAHRNPIDRFVAAALQARGLTFSPEADRRTLIRRLSLDLLGLPPTPEEIRAFETDPDPAAYERLLDRMLASPHYGERWARHWLDIAHYADTHGFERDQRRDHAYRYRDWVIRALNDDRPYDAFLRDQIAGDALRPDDPTAVIATGFLAAGPWDFVGQAETPSPVLKRLARADDLDDLITQVLTATCAVTIHCARCHDHKLDPIPQKDYYALWAVFAGVKRGDRTISTTEQRQYTLRKLQLEGDERALKNALSLLGGGTLDGLPRERLRVGRLAEIATALQQLPEPDKVYAIVTEPPPEVRLLARGDTESPRDLVPPGTITCLSNLPNDWSKTALTDAQRRIAFADWVTHPANPLPRRVMVNRLWQHHFGVGIVETPSDFGLGGGLPSHPELLDWLAERLLQEQWSLKALHRLICQSHTYRQSSHPGKNPGRQLDSANRLLWRQNPRRLDAESLRDAVLTASGTLNSTMYGPGYRDFDYREEYAPVYTYITADRPDLWRRTIYRFTVRTTPHRFLTTLDCPNPANLTPTRSVTTTALQSLALLNDEFMIRQAGHLAARIQREVGADVPTQSVRAFELTFGRPPVEAERRAAETLIGKQSLAAVCRMLLNANEFVTAD